MAFPSTLDTFPDPVGADSLASSGGKDQVHYVTELQDAIERLEAKVGVDGSADTDSLDYKASHIVGATPPFSPALVVASSEMPASIKAIADYVGTGSNDAAQANLATEKAGALIARSNAESTNLAQQRGMVLFTGGRFYAERPVIIQSGEHISGMGHLTQWRPLSGSMIAGGNGPDAAMFKIKNNKTHNFEISHMWLDGNSNSGVGHGIYAFNDGNDSAGDPYSASDSYTQIHDLYLCRFFHGSATRHGIYFEGNTSDIRASMFDRIIAREFTGCGLYVNGAPDGHMNLIQVGAAARLPGNTTAGSNWGGIRIAAGNYKITNSKSFYCGAGPGEANTLGWGVWISSGRGMMAAVETQDCASGFFFDSAPWSVSSIEADTSLIDNILLSTSRLRISSATVFIRSGGRYSGATYGIRADGLYTNMRCEADVDPTNITNPVFRTGQGAITSAASPTLFGAASVADISYGTASGNIVNQRT